jgi:hypothetical protein
MQGGIRDGLRGLDLATVIAGSYCIDGRAARASGTLGAIGCVELDI